MQEALNLKWDYVKWMRPVDIVASLGDQNAMCVGMLGLFPGLRWRGAFLAISAYIRPATHINKLADKLQAYALGVGTRYLAGIKPSSSTRTSIYCSYESMCHLEIYFWFEMIHNATWYYR